MSFRPIPAISGAILVTGLLACGGGGGAGGPQSFSLTLFSNTHILAPGESVELHAQSSEGASPKLELSSTGGAVQQIGSAINYTAPPTPGRYVVQARLSDHPEVVSSVVMQVIQVTAQMVGNLPEGPGWRPYVRTNLLTDGRIAIMNASPLGPMLWDPSTESASRTTACPIRPQFPSTGMLPGDRWTQFGGGGLISSPDPHTIYAYDPIHDSWSDQGQVYFQRYLETATVMHDGRVLIAGGETGGVSQNPTMEIWDPAVGGIATVFSYMQVPRSNHTATLLPNGSVLIAGGGYGMRTLDGSEIVTSDLKSQLGPTMATIREGHSATPLTDGRILFAGGGYSALLEAFNPASMRFENAGSLSSGVTSYSAVAPLPGGRALSAGGVVNTPPNYPVSNGIEVFDPEVRETRVLATLPDPVYGAMAVHVGNGIVYVFGGGNNQGAPTWVVRVTVH